MIKFKVSSKKITFGTHKGETGYFATPASNNKRTLKSIIQSIVRATSLSEGDVENAITSLTNVIKDSLSEGTAVDLGVLGSFKVVIPSRNMLAEEDVTAAKALKTPHIVYYPRQELKELVARVPVTVDNPKNRKQNDAGSSTPSGETPPTGDGGGTETPGGSGGTTPGGDDNPDGIE